MTIRLRALPNSNLPVWSPRYERSDYALSAGTLGPLRLSAGDVTLSFDSGGVLVGLDAYTNSHSWQEGALPAVPGVPARLVSVASFDENGVGPTSTSMVGILLDRHA